METQTQTFVYETLTPLSLTTTSPPPSPSPPPQPSSSQPAADEPSPYVVFRNELSQTSLHCPSPKATATVDYFSLDVGADSDEILPLNSIKEDFVAVTPVKGIAGAAVQVKPPVRTLESSWWFKGNSMFKSPMMQLHKEILDFCDFLSPTQEEQASRNAAVDSVFGVIKYIWPNCNVEVFGSFKTGIYLPSSDIDVVILGSDIKTPQTGLHALSRALSQRGVAKKIQVIAKARVPIIKFVEKKSGIAFDISFDVDNGPKAAEFIKDALNKLPPLRPLCLILKVFLQQRELNEVYTGGIGSYALLVMLISMLQSHWESHRAQTSPEHNLGILLEPRIATPVNSPKNCLGLALSGREEIISILIYEIIGSSYVNFFDFYGRKLNTWDVGVSCNKTGSFFLKSSRGFKVQGRPFLISIEDPQQPENDIGKNSFNYFQIRSAFAMAVTTLTNVKHIMGLGPNRSILGTIIRPDPVLLERKGGYNGDMTFNDLLPGAGEPLEPQYEDHQEFVGNWQYGDVEEEPLPRENGINGDIGTRSSGKKRKSPKDKSGQKAKENGDAGVKHSSKRDKFGNKKRRRQVW